MNAGTVRLERIGSVALVELDRPERRHAMNVTMWDALEAVLDDLEGALPRAVVLTGSGDRAFCAGMDVRPDNPQIADLIQAVQQHDRAPVEVLIERLRRAVDRLAGLPVPVIAAVNGLAYGGGAELAVRCDMRVVDPSAVFCFQEVRLGLMPDWGGGPALARLVGPSRACDLILTARTVGAEEALRLGLADRVSAPGQSRAEALGIAQSMAENGPRAVRAALRVIRSAADMPQREALDLELDLACDLIATGECAVGIPAFIAKMRPQFPDP